MTQSLSGAGERHSTLTGLNRKEMHWLVYLDCVQVWLDPGSENGSLGNCLSPSLVPAFSVSGSLSGSLSPRGVTGGPQQLLASIVPAQKPSRKRVPLSQWPPLVSRDGVSSDVFGHMRSPWPWGSSLHPAQGGERARGLRCCPDHADCMAGGGVCRTGAPWEDSDAVPRRRKSGRLGQIHRCPRQLPHGDRLTRRLRALAWDPSSQGWILGSVIM